jgi:hypothetical protein
MSDRRDEDIRAAYELIGKWDADDEGTYMDLARRIADLRAAERDKARAPFLRLAVSLIEDEAPVGTFTVRGAYRDAADRIRRAAQDNP